MTTTAAATLPGFFGTLTGTGATACAIAPGFALALDGALGAPMPRQQPATGPGLAQGWPLASGAPLTSAGLLLAELPVQAPLLASVAPPFQAALPEPLVNGGQPLIAMSAPSALPTPIASAAPAASPQLSVDPEPQPAPTTTLSPAPATQSMAPAQVLGSEAMAALPESDAPAPTAKSAAPAAEPPKSTPAQPPLPAAAKPAIERPIVPPAARIEPWAIPTQPTPLPAPIIAASEPSETTSSGSPNGATVNDEARSKPCTATRDAAQATPDAMTARAVPAPLVDEPGVSIPPVSDAPGAPMVMEQPLTATDPAAPVAALMPRGPARPLPARSASRQGATPDITTNTVVDPAQAPVAETHTPATPPRATGTLPLARATEFEPHARTGTGTGTGTLDVQAPRDDADPAPTVQPFEQVATVALPLTPAQTPTLGAAANAAPASSDTPVSPSATASTSAGAERHAPAAEGARTASEGFAQRLGAQPAPDQAPVAATVTDATAPLPGTSSPVAVAARAEAPALAQEVRHLPVVSARPGALGH